MDRLFLRLALMFTCACFGPGLAIGSTTCLDFNSPLSSGCVGTATSLAAGDFNRDGFADVAAYTDGPSAPQAITSSAT